MKLIYLIPLILAGCATHTITNGVPNLHEVDPGVWRGGQPTVQGWLYLKGIGVSNVVKLNTKFESSDYTDMRVVYIPINTFHQIFGPVSNSVMRAASEITPGTFIHCKHGVNRTGTVIMVYRVKHDGWSKDRAEKEGLDYGWGDSLPALKHFWIDWKP